MDLHYVLNLSVITSEQFLKERLCAEPRVDSFPTLHRGGSIRMTHVASGCLLQQKRQFQSLDTPCCQSQHATPPGLWLPFHLLAALPSIIIIVKEWLPLELDSEGNSHYIVRIKKKKKNKESPCFPGLHFHITSNINTHHHDCYIEKSYEADTMCISTNSPVMWSFFRCIGKAEGHWELS